MGAHEDLDETVRAAKAATDDLVKLLALHGMSTAAVTELREHGRQDPVRAAFTSWQQKVTDIVPALAAQHRANDAASSARDREELTIRAYLLAFGFA